MHALSLRRQRARRGPAAPAGARVGTLYERHGRMVFGLCRMLLRDPTEAEDATQQVFLDAYRSLLGGTVVRDDAAWLATIARHECRHRARQRMREPLSLDEDVQIPTPRGTLEEAERRLEVDALRGAIAALPERQREAVVLRDLYGLGYRDVGAALGVSRPAVETLLFRARRTLRVRLRPVAGVLVLPLAVREAVAQAVPGFVDGVGAAGAGGAAAGTGAGLLAKLLAAPATAKVAAVTVAATAAGSAAVSESDGPPAAAPPPPPAAVQPAPARPEPPAFAGGPTPVAGLARNAGNDEGDARRGGGDRAGAADAGQEDDEQDDHSGLGRGSDDDRPGPRGAADGPGGRGDADDDREDPRRVAAPHGGQSEGGQREADDKDDSGSQAGGHEASGASRRSGGSAAQPAAAGEAERATVERGDDDGFSDGFSPERGSGDTEGDRDGGSGSGEPGGG